MTYRTGAMDRASPTRPMLTESCLGRVVDSPALRDADGANHGLAASAWRCRVSALRPGRSALASAVP
jgi:hypothetical protein